MKRLFLTLLLVLLSIVMIGNVRHDQIPTSTTLNVDNDGIVYRHFGTANWPINYNTSTTIEAYIVKKVVNNTNQRGLVKYNYQYEIMVKSLSTVNGYPTNTNMYGVRVFYNGKETSAKTFPNGFNVLILQEPTMIYWLESNDEFPDIKFNWVDARYQTLK